MHGPYIIGESIAITILLALGVAGAWDIYCMVESKPSYWYVSAYLTSWAQSFPILTFLAGILIGHLLWGIGANSQPPK